MLSLFQEAVVVMIVNVVVMIVNVVVMIVNVVVMIVNVVVMIVNVVVRSINAGISSRIPCIRNHRIECKQVTVIGSSVVCVNVCS